MSIIITFIKIHKDNNLYILKNTKIIFCLQYLGQVRWVNTSNNTYPVYLGVFFQSFVKNVPDFPLQYGRANFITKLSPSMIISYLESVCIFKMGFGWERSDKNLNCI